MQLLSQCGSKYDSLSNPSLRYFTMGEGNNNSYASAGSDDWIVRLEWTRAKWKLMKKYICRLEIEVLLGLSTRVYVCVSG